MANPRSFVAVLFLACVAALAAGPLQGQTDLTRLILDSPLIVRGTVVGTGSPSRLLVTDTLRGADTIGSFTGQEIILGRTTSSDRKEGVFFIRPIAYGKTLVGQEVGEIDPPTDDRAFTEQIAKVLQQDETDKLAARTASAETVILGKVLSIRPLRETSLPTEHDPDWAIAQVLVVRTLSGQPRSSECGQDRCVDVAFARSDDIRWFRAPKLAVGQQNVMLLRPPDPKLLRETELPPAPYALIEAADLRPATEEPRLRALTVRGQ